MSAGYYVLVDRTPVEVDIETFAQHSATRRRSGDADSWRVAITEFADGTRGVDRTQRGAVMIAVVGWVLLTIVLVVVLAIVGLVALIRRR